ncbi:hypothetical protein [Klebsiella phage 05F01]|nr:hypothetical protein [Klebsiella phage 05F01]
MVFDDLLLGGEYKSYFDVCSDTRYTITQIGFLYVSVSVSGASFIAKLTVKNFLENFYKV